MLPTSHEDDLRFYVHAGVCPGVPLDQQNDDAKLWIRESFLRHRGPFPKYIVHGHTPTIYLDPAYQRELRRRASIIKDHSGQDFMLVLDDLVKEAAQEAKSHK